VASVSIAVRHWSCMKLILIVADESCVALDVAYIIFMKKIFSVDGNL